MNAQQQADAKKPRPPTIYDARSPKGTLVPGRRPQKKFPYNTRLDNGRGTMQVCCKCFSRPSQGACSAHHAELYLRLCEAEQALEEGCGLAWDAGIKLASAQSLLEALYEAAQLKPVTGGGSPVVALLPPELLRRVKLTIDELKHVEDFPQER